MSLLEKLWDDTLAGPHPDSGLTKFRKHTNNTLNLPSKELDGGSARPVAEEGVRVTRRIMIVKPPPGGATPPISPAASTPPASPFSGSRQGFRFRRRSTSDAYENASEAGEGARGPSSP